jgi:predicted O-methyltransferase YrrM
MNRPLEVYKNTQCPVQTIQFKWEFEELLKIYRQLHPKNILEIGSFFGGTLWHWMDSSPNAHFTVIDKITATDEVLRCRQEMAQKTLWKYWASSYNSQLSVYSGDSADREIFEEVKKNGPFDFAFIDGDHSYNGVKSDYLMYKGLIRPGGIMAFHDILEPKQPELKYIEVYKFWKEIVEHGHRVQELYSSKEQCHENYGTMGIGVVHC